MVGRMIDDGPGISEYEPKPVNSSENSFEKETVPPRVNDNKISEFFEPYHELMEDVVEYSKSRAQSILDKQTTPSGPYRVVPIIESRATEKELKEKINDSSGAPGRLIQLLVTVVVGYFLFTTVMSNMFSNSSLSANPILNSVQNTFMPIFIMAGIAGALIAVLTTLFRGPSRF